jgi:hypothetical protein
MFNALLLVAALAAEEPDAAALLKTADAPRQAFLHSTLRVRVTVELEDSAPQIGDLDVYLGNETQQLVVFRDNKNKGRKFLMVDDKAWLIVPGSANPIAVTANQRMLGASSLADIARVRLSRDYTGTVRTGTEPCGEPAQPCRVVDITASVRTAPYASGTLWIGGDGFVRKAIYKLASGKAAKEMAYQYKDSNGQTAPARLILTDLLLGKTGKTTIEYLDYRPAQHSASIFDPHQQVKR